MTIRLVVCGVIAAVVPWSGSLNVAASDDSASREGRSTFNTMREYFDVSGYLTNDSEMRGTSIHDLLPALAGDEPLHAPLPGTSASLYDALQACL